ncbi:DUF779 domain-containing protein [Costertonia aggregata]|uniref:DUF779 domain-containing protein n=1 Tax=Costertonia aggregata TaxID=343403 RepID=A0A7H9ARV5_9FLAO|nr:DUF779 domain-containing protein [Costertonia aggregata]QLG46184.1 DUF779 domain-containing protein [Costertonia aggregata]
MKVVKRVLVTPEAEEVIGKLKETHGELMFHQSGGCCDGSSPMCFPKGDFMINENDVWLGNICDCDFYMSKDQFEYWKHTQLTVGIVKGRGASFSLEIPMGIRFIIHSKLFTEEERHNLEPIHLGEE